MGSDVALRNEVGRRHLLQRYCDERCAEFGEPGCWSVDPDGGFCADCIDDADRAIEFVSAALAVEAATPKDQQS